MTYAIGDLQGCQDAFQSLLATLPTPVSPANLIFLGDLINRGPDSLACLRWVKNSGARTVLGNHDLHLLAVVAGLRAPSTSDTLEEILSAPDRDELITWLRQQPLAIFEKNHLFIHAGVVPQWDAQTTVSLAQEVQQILAGPNWREFLATMYGNTPSQWHNGLQGPDRLRVIVNALTRLRFCTADGHMEFVTKEGAGSAPAGHMPWFDVPNRLTGNVTVVFGHWSTLGLLNRPNLIGLDTGCVWGGKLSAVCLEDRAVFQVACPQAATPGQR
jgi:bis(5'-nucleosyl)-tetraphosphatase (symmetrical)